MTFADKYLGKSKDLQIPARLIPEYQSLVHEFRAFSSSPASGAEIAKAARGRADSRKQDAKANIETAAIYDELASIIEAHIAAGGK